MRHYKTTKLYSRSYTHSHRNTNCERHTLMKAMKITWTGMKARYGRPRDDSGTWVNCRLEALQHRERWVTVDPTERKETDSVWILCGGHFDSPLQLCSHQKISKAGIFSESPNNSLLVRHAPVSLPQTVSPLDGSIVKALSNLNWSITGLQFTFTQTNTDTHRHRNRQLIKNYI